MTTTPSAPQQHTTETGERDAQGLASPWRFDGNYKNTEQVAAFMPAFLERFAELDPTLRFAYNDSFRGHVAGIEGPCEDTAIYLLQGRKRLLELEAKIAQAVTDGFVEVTETAEPLKCSAVVHYGFYTGGDGWREWHDVRLVPAGSGMAVLSKRARTHGHIIIGGHVLAKL
ncbi:MAG: hypothetical protein ACYCST_10030 [Acidimicrobiales bacterium]